MVIILTNQEREDIQSWFMRVFPRFSRLYVLASSCDWLIAFSSLSLLTCLFHCFFFLGFMTSLEYGFMERLISILLLSSEIINHSLSDKLFHNIARCALFG